MVVSPAGCAARPERCTLPGQQHTRAATCIRRMVGEGVGVVCVVKGRGNAKGRLQQRLGGGDNAGGLGHSL